MANISDLIHGKKPEVAEFIRTDPIAELQKLIRGEISSWEDITNLSNLYQDYMLGAYDTAGLDLQQLIGLGSADTAALLEGANPLIRGEIPDDVKAQVLRNAAYQGLTSGTLGGPMGASIGARDLGLTSLQLMNQGANLLTAGGNAAQRWQSIASGTILPPTASMYSPEWFANFQADQNARQQATKQFKFNVEAAPDPAWADRAALLASYGGMALGGAMGGGMGKGGSGSTIGQGYSSMMGTGVDFGSPSQVPAAGYYDPGKNVVDPNMSPFNAYYAPQGQFVPDQFIPTGQGIYNWGRY